MVGATPDVELKDGVVTLRRTGEAGGDRERGVATNRASFAVGPAIEAILRDGDELIIRRGAAADLSVVVFREESLIAGAGALSHFPLGADVAVREDPRASEQRLYGIAATLKAPGTAVVWVDSENWSPESLAARLVQSGGERLVLAIAGPTRSQRLDANGAIASSGLTMRFSSCRYVDVDERFATEDEWRAYIDTLPTSRPDDMWIEFGLGHEDVRVAEGNYALAPPWHLFVVSVYRPGIPGEPSQLAIVRESPAVTKSMVEHTARVVAAGRGDYNASPSHSGHRRSR